MPSMPKRDRRSTGTSTPTRSGRRTSPSSGPGRAAAGSPHTARPSTMPSSSVTTTNAAICAAVLTGGRLRDAELRLHLRAGHRHVEHELADVHDHARRQPALEHAADVDLAHVSPHAKCVSATTWAGDDLPLRRLRVRRRDEASCAGTGAPPRSSRSRRGRSRCCCRAPATSSRAKSCAMRSGARTRTSISIAAWRTASRRFARRSATAATIRGSSRRFPSAASSSSRRSTMVRPGADVTDRQARRLLARIAARACWRVSLRRDRLAGDSLLRSRVGRARKPGP